MVVDSILPKAEFRRNDHQEHAPHFTETHLSNLTEMTLRHLNFWSYFPFLHDLRASRWHGWIEEFQCYLSQWETSRISAPNGGVTVLAVSTQDLADTGAVWPVSIGSQRRSVTPNITLPKPTLSPMTHLYFQLKHCKLPGCENVVISNRFGHYCSDECNVQFVSQCFRAFVNHRPTSAKQAWCSNSWFSIAISNRQDWPGPTGPVIIPA